MTMPEWLLAVGVLSQLLLANALRSIRGITPLVVPSFAAGWPLIEAPLHVAALLTVTVAALLVGGALQGWQGGMGLSLSALALVGLGVLHRRGVAAEEVVEAALIDVLGEDYRERLRQAAVEVDRPLPPGRLLWPLRFADPAVEVLRDIPYIDDGDRRHLLDIHRPVDADRHAPAPVLLQIHGGGWSIGHKAQQARPLMGYMASAGWLCVAVNYRLSPAARWPAHLLDVKRALLWVKAHIVDYGGDPAMIIVTGGSAGGHLAAMLGLTAGVARWQPGFEQANTSVQGVIPCYGVYDLVDSERQWCYRGWRWFIQRVVMSRDSEDRRLELQQASPLNWINRQAPPFLIIHGDNDSLVCCRMARAFSQQLRGQSTQPTGLLELPGAQHAFDLFYSPRTLAVIRGIHRYAETLRLNNP